MKATGPFVYAIALATLVVTACDDDNKVDPQDELTQKEAVALLGGLAELMADSTIQPIHASEDSVVLPCTKGGRVKFVGGVKEETRADTSVVSSDFMITPAGCKLVPDDLDFTADGDAGVRQHLEVKIWIEGGGPNFDVAGGFKGGLKWMLDSRSGSCAVDLTFVPDNTLDPEDDLTGVWKGALCGHQVEVNAKDFLPG